MKLSVSTSHLFNKTRFVSNDIYLMDYKDHRKKLIKWTKEQLIGFKLKNDILVGEKPLDRFFTGFLFPIIESEDGLDSDTEGLDSDDVNETKPAKKQKRYIPPSSVGFSFYITGEQIKLRVVHDALYYKKLYDKNQSNQKFISQEHPKGQRWQKNLITRDKGDEIEFTPYGMKRYDVFDGKAKIDALWRKHDNGYIVTITLSNAQKIKDDGSKNIHLKKNERTLFEVMLRCIIQEGNIDRYPSKNKALLNDEEKEIELRYKDLRIYAVGHGAAVDWAKNKSDQMEIWADFIPSVEVPQVTADTGDNSSKVLEFDFLSSCENNNDVVLELKKFTADYADWIESQREKVSTEDKEDHNGLVS